VIGYSNRPTILRLLVYLTTLAVIFVLMKLYVPVVARPSAAR